MLDRVIDKLGDWNPQLFRETKGRLQTKNLVIASATSIVGQITLLLLLFNDRNSFVDSLSGTGIQWSEFWLYTFLSMSLLGIIFILVGGMYLVIEDLYQENKKGTLNFIRLSPQSYHKIILGKIIGVPILLYWMMLLALPLQLIAGLKGGIPLGLILVFNLIVVLSCFFFYSVGSLFGLLSNKAVTGYSVILPVVLCFYLLVKTISCFSPYVESTGTPIDWIGLFYPGSVLSYLVEASGHLDLGYFTMDQLTSLRWYEFYLWRYPTLGMLLIIANLGVCTYWVWQGLKRRFSNTHSLLLSKNQSYWFSTTTMGIVFGFALQSENPTRMFNNFAMVLFFHLMVIMGLTFALTSQRQVLQDWARYRRDHSLLRDLIFGEKSPAIVSLTINALISGMIMLPGILLMFGTYTPVAIFSLLSQVILLVIYGLVLQLILLRCSQKREIWGKSAVVTMLILPPIILGILGLFPHNYPQFWLFVPVSLYAFNHGAIAQFILPVLFQGIIIALGSWTLTKQLQRLGESETKAIGE